MKTETATLPSHWASALINGDFSGMSEADEAELAHILDLNPEWNQPVDCEEVGFCWAHDATPYGVLAGDCSKYTFLRSEE